MRRRDTETMYSLHRPGRDVVGTISVKAPVVRSPGRDPRAEVVLSAIRDELRFPDRGRYAIHAALSVTASALKSRG